MNPCEIRHTSLVLLNIVVPNRLNDSDWAVLTVISFIVLEWIFSKC